MKYGIFFIHMSENPESPGSTIIDIFGNIHAKIKHNLVLIRELMKNENNSTPVGEELRYEEPKCGKRIKTTKLFKPNFIMYMLDYESTSSKRLYRVRSIILLI